ncbi:IS66 family transposase, partial [Myroides odoratimimus]|nr:IS66 family transposase [Myroides odoratimimus]MDM1507690.1 IS66 family transposase [Myroides odoratimimus]MDM1518168.1 IS66 family transposase [Myroides odoratimimus]
MEIDLENLSKQELLALLTKAQKTISKQEKVNTKLEKKTTSLEEKTSKLEEKNTELEYRVKLLERMKFGQSRERFEDPNQTQLPLDVEQAVLEEQEEVIKQEITYSREKKKHPGRAKLPDHLPVEEIEIHPEGDLSDMICIGKETTDVLDYVPGYFKIKRYIRYKYATKGKDNTQISIG